VWKDLFADGAPQVVMGTLKKWRTFTQLLRQFGQTGLSSSFLAYTLNPRKLEKENCRRGLRCMYNALWMLSRLILTESRPMWHHLTLFGLRGLLATFVRTTSGPPFVGELRRAEMVFSQVHSKWPIHQQPSQALFRTDQHILISNLVHNPRLHFEIL
jgi:hypothetical protein